MHGVRLLLLAVLLGCCEAGESSRAVHPASIAVPNAAAVEANRAQQVVVTAALLTAELLLAATVPWCAASLVALAGEPTLRGDDGGARTAMLSARHVPNALNHLFDFDAQAEAEPKPDVEPEPTETQHSHRAFSDLTGCSCRATSRTGPNSATLLALLALAAARARHQVVWRGASA